MSEVLAENSSGSSALSPRKLSISQDGSMKQITPAQDSSAEGSQASASQGLKQVFGIDHRDTCNELLSQTLCTIPNCKDRVEEHVESVTAMLQGIGPRDAVEGLLAVQMVGVHNLAMDSMARAGAPGQAFEVIAANVNLATKLLRTYTTQMEALDRHRRPSGQPMVIGNVNVNDGGQAIVGPVNHPVPGKESEDNEKKAG
jgi:hypothetical protein